jgi:hypothetical protein
MRTWQMTAMILLSGLGAAASADEGMWLFERPPVKQLKQRYGFEPSPAWLEHVQKSCLRMGASGSFVSANGLVLTNHHVGADQLEKMSTPEHNLLETGFYARTPDQEVRCPDIDAQILWSIEDVTARVNGAAQAGMSPAAAATARRKITNVIEAEAQQQSGMQCEVVTLWGGARYHLYRYRRYTDVRLVFAPEQQIAFFGGDNDNFEYPRYDLDICLFRVYENGQPLKPEHYLRWSANGAKDGELIFVAGHPFRTQRWATVADLKFLRDVDVLGQLQNLWRREVQLVTFLGRSTENARIGWEDYLGAQNSRKARTGIIATLLDPAVLREKEQAERALRAALTADERARWGDAWDQVVTATQNDRPYCARRAAVDRLFGGTLPGHALHLVRLAAEKPKPNADRLSEYADANIETLNLDLFSPAPIYEALEIDRLDSALSALAETLGGDDELVALALGGQAPHARAVSLVRGSKLKDVAVRKQLAEGGQPAISACADPLIQFAIALDPASRALRKRYEDEVESLRREAYAKIAAARFAKDGEDQYPDATFTLRLSFGPIKGYEEDGASMPPFTDFKGLYERSAGRKGQPPFNLPSRWVERKGRLNPRTPMNFVCTADIIGGNSGSPAVNQAGEIVGVIFDGNLQGLAWDIVYGDKQGRALAVDTRAISEALRVVYDADALARELEGK